MVICLLVQLPWQHKAPIDDLWRKQRILIGRAHLVLVYLALYLSREIIETLLLSLIVTVSHFRMPALHIKSCHNEYFGIMLKCPIYILHCLILEAPSRIAAYNTHFCFSDKIRLTLMWNVYQHFMWNVYLALKSHGKPYLFGALVKANSIVLIITMSKCCCFFLRDVVPICSR